MYRVDSASRSFIQSHFTVGTVHLYSLSGDITSTHTLKEKTDHFCMMLNGKVNGGEQKKADAKLIRKQERERQRRSDLANAFEELSLMLDQIDPESNGDESGKAKSQARITDTEAAESTGGLSRIDLLARTMDVLRHLKDENTRLQKLALERKPGSSGSDEVFKNKGDCLCAVWLFPDILFLLLTYQVLVMVPTLTPIGDAQPGGPQQSVFPGATYHGQLPTPMLPGGHHPLSQPRYQHEYAHHPDAIHQPPVQHHISRVRSPVGSPGAAYHQFNWAATHQSNSSTTGPSSVTSFHPSYTQHPNPQVNHRLVAKQPPPKK